MLTEKEYLEALNIIKRDDLCCNCSEECNKCEYHKSLNILKDLICNLPKSLNVEEMKINTVYWDDISKVRCYFDTINYYIGAGMKNDIYPNKTRRSSCEITEGRFFKI